jgi:hypothetical protein
MAASPGTTGVDVTVSQAICEQSNVPQGAVKQGGEALCWVASVESVEYDVVDQYGLISAVPETLGCPKHSVSRTLRESRTPKLR